MENRLIDINAPICDDSAIRPTVYVLAGCTLPGRFRPVGLREDGTLIDLLSASIPSYARDEYMARRFARESRLYKYIDCTEASMCMWWAIEGLAGAIAKYVDRGGCEFRKVARDPIPDELPITDGLSGRKLDLSLTRQYDSLPTAGGRVSYPRNGRTYKNRRR